MIKLCALWKSKNGKALTGRLGNLKLVVTKNNYKKEDKQPDYVVFVDEYEKRTEEVIDDEKDFIEDYGDVPPPPSPS